MLNTKLILVEGLPGAGKSSTTVHLGKILQQLGIPCRWFREEDDPHPLPCLDLEIKGLPQKMIPLWKNFTELALHEQFVTILESRLWQNTGLYMFMSENNVDDIIKFNLQVYEALTPLSPVLLYLDQDDTNIALRGMRSARGEQWMEATLQETTQYPWFRSRDLNDFPGWVKFFEEWRPIAEQFYDLWPHSKLRIPNAHADWPNAYQQIYGFLQIAA